MAAGRRKPSFAAPALPSKGLATARRMGRGAGWNAANDTAGSRAAAGGSKPAEAGVSLRLSDVVALTCFRGRKFSRARFSRFVVERIGATESTERTILHLAPELLAMFFSREMRLVTEDRAPVNECFELPDGQLLEFVGDHMEAAEIIARLLLKYDEARLEHVVELLRTHDRSWLHTLAVEARDGRLTELGFSDLDDVGRLYAPWHAVLLLRKLAASMGRKAMAQRRTKAPPLRSEDVTQYFASLHEPERRVALERLRFLAACQAVHDAKRHVRRLTPKSYEQATRRVLRMLARGLRKSGVDMAALATPQIATIFRLGLTTEPAG